MKPNRQSTTTRALAILVVLLFLLVSTVRAAPAGQAGDPWPTVALPASALQTGSGIAAKAPDGDPLRAKLDTALYDLVVAVRSAPDQAVSLADARELRRIGDRIQVHITTDAANLPAVRAAILAAGGEVTGIAAQDTLLQAWLPLRAIERVAALPEVQAMRQPATFHTLQGTVTTEGVTPMGATAWHTAGYRGAGVRIGVIDLGFNGWTALRGSDLPASVTVRNFVDGEPATDVSGTTAHGTACAEIVYDVAPAATLYLAKIATTVDMDEAVTWLMGQGVNIISTSLGTWDGPGDGTGYTNQIVARARAAGVLWVTAAGNERENHWAGAYLDPDNDAVHNWNGAQEINYFGPGDGSAYLIPAGVQIRAFLRWDDWTNVNQDYDLYLVRWNGSSWSQVASSSRFQNGAPGQTPTEQIVYTTSGAAAPYGFIIERYRATRAVRFDFFASPARLDEIVPAGSLSSPGDSPNALTAAAVDVSPPFPQEPYSSEGPTNGPGGTANGGIIKPDLAAFANVSSVSYGPRGFNGTSAATPHVAGAAALVMSAFPTYQPGDVQAFLEGRAIDQGATGRDNQFGAGRLFLGEPPPPQQPGTLQFSAPSITVNESGGSASLMVTRTGGSSGAVSVTCATTSGGTATAGVDYTPVSRTLVFANGDSMPKTCSVPIIDDAEVEGDETIAVALSNPTGGAALGNPAIAEVRITDNDLPALTINDVTVPEGNSGVTDAVFTVRLSAASPAPVSVVYRTRDGSATAPSDYTAIPSTTLTFAPGEVTRTISVAVNGDTLVEPDETFFVELSLPVNATIGRGQGTGVIRNDDVGVSLPALSIDDVTIVEGDTGTTSASLTVRLSAPGNQTVSVVYQTQNGTAVAGSDYAPVGATTLTFAPGVIVQTIAVSILGDNVFEPDETVIVTLSAPVNATIARSQATVTIQNDDPRRVYLPLIVKPAPPPPPSSGWMTLVSEDFEGNFPGNWRVSDEWPGWGEYTWSRRNCLAVSGAHSGWAVGGGADGSRLPCGSYYPNNAESWMVYGPFSLADATAADLRLKLWLNSEMYVDDLCMMASVDGRNFAGSCTTGVTNGWVDETLDLTNVYQLGNLTGRSQVWIAVVFSSDATITRPIGAYVDDIVLRKYVTSAGSALPPSEAVTAPPASATLVTRPAQLVYSHAVDRP